MKHNILKLMIVAGLIALSADLRAFTAVTSGAWSNAATWGGIGPGSTVNAQDVIIPSGITVDMDTDVSFNGPLNSLWVTGTLMTSSGKKLDMVAGTVTGSGNISLAKLNMSGGSIYSFTGPMSLDVFANSATAVNLTSQVNVNDTLSLNQGVVMINSGGDLQIAHNAIIDINSGSISNGGGIFTTGMPYDVWYRGITQYTGEELTTGFVRDVHVWLNSNANTLYLSSNANINGELDMTSGHVALNGKRLRLYGDLSRNTGAIFEGDGGSDLVIQGSGAMSSPIVFAAGESLDELTISRDTFTVDLASDLTVTGAVRLESGWLHVLTGNTLTMGTGSLISLTDGRFDFDGTFDGSALYNLEYIGNDSASTGLETTGSGLNNLTVNLGWHTDKLMLTRDAIVHGAFHVLQGYFLVYAQKTLRVEGDFHQNSNTMIAGDPNSNLELVMSNSVNDTLWMAYWDNTWGNFELDIPSNSILTCAYYVGVQDTLKLTSGRIRLMNYSFKIATTGVIVGADADSYIIAEDTGTLRRFHPGLVAASYVDYPIGTMNHYCPVSVSNLAQSFPGYIGVRVKHGMYADGETGIDESQTVGCVNKTWIVEPDSGLPTNMDVKLGWNLANEVNMFDRNNAYIKGYWNTQWNPYAAGQAAAASWTNSYELERFGITDAGAFAVVDSSNLLTVPTVNTHDGMNVYPNPVTDQLTVSNANLNGDAMKYQVYDAVGRLVIEENSTDVTHLMNFGTFDKGTYTLRITNLATNEVVTRKIVK